MDNNEISYDIEQKRELAKKLLLSESSSEEDVNYGLKLLEEVIIAGDPEGCFFFARLVLDDFIELAKEDDIEFALDLLCYSADNGCIQARAFLNQYCETQYMEKCNERTINKDVKGPLVGFDGKPIKINRQGIFTPIDAVLEYKDGKNILTLSVNVLFAGCEELPDPVEFKYAVFKGLQAWEGEYEVFGGQKLEVRLEITFDDKLFDSVLISPVCGTLESTFNKVISMLPKGERKERMTNISENKRSFAVSGGKWSVNSRKFIYIQSENGAFDDYEEIMHVAKHEFGHSLGLGDLYASEVDSLDGVKKGAFVELDGYLISDNFYNLVMCDHYGPISNNDIEMVVLAFKENKIQLYQTRKVRDKISSALGRGN